MLHTMIVTAYLFLCFYPSIASEATTFTEKTALHSNNTIQSYEELATYVRDAVSPASALNIYDVKPMVLIQYCACKHNINIFENSPYVIHINDLYKHDTEKYDALVEQVVIEMLKPTPFILNIAQKFQDDAISQIDYTKQQIEQIIPKYKKKKNAYRHCFCKNAVLGLMATAGLTVIAVFSWIINHCDNVH